MILSNIFEEPILYIAIIASILLVFTVLSKVFRKRFYLYVRLLFSKRVYIMKWSMKLFFYFNRNKKAELIVTTNSKLYAIKFIAPYGRLSRFKFDNKRRLFIRDYHIRGGASMTRIDFPYDFDFQRKMLETIAFKHNIEEVVICLAFIPANLGVYSGDDDCVTHISGDTVGGIKLFVSAKELYNYIITDVAEFPKQQTVQLKEEIKQMKNV